MTIKVKNPRSGSKKLRIGGTYRGVRVREGVDLYPGQEEQAALLIEAREREIDELLAAEAEREQNVKDGEADWRCKSFEDACDHYLNKGGSAKYLGQYDVHTGSYTKGLLQHFEGYKLGAISEELVFKKIAMHWPASNPAVASTKNRCFIGPLRAVFAATSSALCPVEKLRECQPGTRSASPQEVSESLDAYSDLPHLQALTMTMTVTGRRISELVGLSREAMGSDGVITIGKTKNGDAITIEVPAFLAKQILALPLFPNGRLFGYKTRHSVYGAMKRRCAKRKITYLPPHQIGRHTFAMTALRAGMDIQEIQIAGGWKSLSALMRYLKLVPNGTQKRAANTVAARLGFGQKDAPQS